MFLRILKNDLKRKKTMNVILLLFVILCSMFAAASINNIIAVTGGIDNYFDKADVPEVIVDIATYTDNDFAEQICALPSVKDVKRTDYLVVLSSKNFSIGGKELTNFINPAALFADDQMHINFFDVDNNIIKDVGQGCFYANAPFLNDLDIKEGDMVKITAGEVSIDLKYMGRFKGALFSSEETSNPYIMIDRADYDKLDKDADAHVMYITRLYMNGADKEELAAFVEEHEGVSVAARDYFKNLYLYDMIAAYIMMIISIVLMLTAFVVLKFSIGFTISEEFREIGVMKAVGIQNGSIRGLYIVKYLAISIVGAVIGFLCSLPLTDMMLKAVSGNIVLGSEHSKLMGLFSVACVVGIILLFCYTSTRRINKLSPIDAVRSGQTGERFGKKSILHLGRSKLPATGFLAANDVLSAPKQFGMITLVFVLCLMMMNLMSNFSLTLSDKSIYPFFDVPDCDVAIMDSNYCKDLFSNQSNTRDIISNTEKLLADNGMPGKCTITVITQFMAHNGDKQTKLEFNSLVGNTDEQLTVDEGYVPQKKDEIMMNISAMNELGVGIGDHITANIGGEEREFIITGRHSSFQTKSAFLCNNYIVEDIPALGFMMGVQIKFDGDPDDAQIARNIDKIKDLTDCENVFTISDVIKQYTGISDTLDTIKYMIMILTVIVSAMIAVLMERSFISKEKSEIALMKAVGISNGSIIGQHTLRFAVTAVAACLLSSAVLMPVSNILMNRICLLIGDIAGMKCICDPVEVFLITPALIIGITSVGAFITAFCTKTIKASDAASIE